MAVDEDSIITPMISQQGHDTLIKFEVWLWAWPQEDHLICYGTLTFYFILKKKNKGSRKKYGGRCKGKTITCVRLQDMSRAEKSPSSNVKSKVYFPHIIIVNSTDLFACYIFLFLYMEFDLKTVTNKYNVCVEFATWHFRIYDNAGDGCNIINTFQHNNLCVAYNLSLSWDVRKVMIHCITLDWFLLFCPSWPDTGHWSPILT